MEAGAHRLERIEGALGRDHAQRVDRLRGRARGHRQRADTARGDAERPGDVVGAPGGDERELRQPAQRRVGCGVERAVAAHQHGALAQRGGVAQRVPQLLFACGHHGLGAGALFLEHGNQRPRAGVRILDAARAPVDHQEKPPRPASVHAVAVMASLLDLDRALVGAAPAFEHPWLTAVFVVLSASWVKGPLLVALGLCSDVWRRRLPMACLAAAVASGAASLVVSALKDTFDRARPPQTDPGLGSLAALPDNPSFPSGHSATAFAAATAVAILSPRLRAPALAIAAAVALSRVYLRVHFPLDVVAGALVGALLGALCALAALRLARAAAPAQAA